MTLNIFSTPSAARKAAPLFTAWASLSNYTPSAVTASSTWFPWTAESKPRLHGRAEFVWRNTGLPQDTCQSANLDFAMHGNHTTFQTTTHDDVASGLAEFLKT